MLVLDACPLGSTCSSSGRDVQPRAALADLSYRRAAFIGSTNRNQSQYTRAKLQQGGSWITCSLSQRNIADQVPPPTKRVPRTAIRMAVPSKGRMAEDTLQLLKDCQLNVYKPNPRQYVASISQMPGLEVWFQRASDVVRKLMYGDVDIGIVGYDMYAEIADGDTGLIVLHDALAFGRCHLGLGIPTGGKWAGINSLDELRSMPEWSETNPLRVVTGYHNIARKFFAEKGFEHVVLLSADGALEAAPLMGTADIILDLVSTGVTLRENNLKQIQGGRIMDSQGVLVGNRAALTQQPGLLAVVHELIERLEAHLKAEQFYSVVANMRGDSPEKVAASILSCQGLRGLQGPTISPVYTAEDTAGAESGTAAASNGSGSASTRHGFYCASICVPKSRLYASIKDLRAIGGSGVLVQPLTYIFDEEPERWQVVLSALGLEGNDPLLASLDGA